jgi:hypothetical protein
MRLFRSLVSCLSCCSVELYIHIKVLFAMWRTYPAGVESLESAAVSHEQQHSGSQEKLDASHLSLVNRSYLLAISNLAIIAILTHVSAMPARS